VGDAAYGGSRAALALERPFLHAGGLAFAHPVTGTPVRVEEDLTADLADVLTGLGA
jgi:23S rRNA-/tRNA-specific pseudouridylate synthase